VYAVLRSFQVTNHRSIRDTAELFLIPTDGGARQVLPVAGVFGANASGKSNLLDALIWLRESVLDSYRRWEIYSGIPRTPYSLDAESQAESSSYVVDILGDDGVQYLYGVELDDQKVREEWLYSYPHGQKQTIFRRTGQKVTFGPKVAVGRARKQFIVGLTRPNALLLSVTVQAEQPEVLPVYRWFSRSVVTVEPPTAPQAVIAMMLEKTAAEAPEFTELLKLADLNIVDYLLVDAPLTTGFDIPALERLPVRPPTGVAFLHGENRALLGWADQSEGTRAWVRVLTSALRALHRGGLLVVDEIDASLHPRLTARLLELFRGPTATTRGAQLLFTTHDATLLSSVLGEKVLSTEEIWFMKKEGGASTIYPLSDFRLDDNEDVEARYLAGNYGAVPVVFGRDLVDAFERLSSTVQQSDSAGRS